MSSAISQSSCYPADSRGVTPHPFWVMDPFGSLMKAIELLLWKRYKSKNMPTLEYNFREFMGQQRSSESPVLGGVVRSARGRSREK